jgi:hypothetical protein
MWCRAIASHLKRPGGGAIARPPATEEAWIRVLCRDCGEVRFGSSSARLHVDADSGTARLSFPCPKCGVRSVRWLPAPVVNQLRRAGVAVRLLTRPAEADEVHVGPPLDELDAADFVRHLERPGWEAHL